MKLRLIRNPRIVQKLAAKKEKHPDAWGVLAPPIYAGDNVAIARAQSLLAGMQLHGGVLTPDQARDVCKWFGVEA